METMTPTRTKRNSKAPNRFSSDNSRIETSNAFGETTMDCNDSNSATTNNNATTNRSIKLKPLIREPLKVKLPKLKRPQTKLTKDSTTKSNKDEIRIHKIKLPSLSSKKTKKIGNESGSKGEINAALLDILDEQTPQQSGLHASSPPSSMNSSKRPSPNISVAGRTTASQIVSSDSPISTRLDVSTTSRSSDEAKSSSAETSFDSDEVDGVSSSRMEIVVSQPDSSNGSGIRCPCGVNDDLGVMVECESCSTWQHGHCINVGTEDEAYEGYICAFCALPQDRVRDSLRELTVGDKFQSRFKLLESTRGQNGATGNHGQQYGCNDTAENNAQLTTKELSQAVSDLRRVMSSLKVKWRLLTSSSYEMELRIWRNCYWSDEKSTGNLDKNNFYFMDICKSNLKLNIRNMLTKLEERCLLIDYAISLKSSNNEKQNGGESTSEDWKLIKQSLEIVATGVEDFKNKLKSLAS